MNPVLAQWLPAIFIVLAVWVGLLYNNKRLDDFKDVMNKRLDDFNDVMNKRLDDFNDVMNKRLDDFKDVMNKRLDDFKDLMTAEIGQSKAEIKSEMQIQIMESEKRILQAISELRVDIQTLERRVARLEAPYIRS